MTYRFYLLTCVTPLCRCRLASYHKHTHTHSHRQNMWASIFHSHQRNFMHRNHLSLSISILCPILPRLLFFLTIFVCVHEHRINLFRIEMNACLHNSLSLTFWTKDQMFNTKLPAHTVQTCNKKCYRCWKQKPKSDHAKSCRERRQNCFYLHIFHSTDDIRRGKKNRFLLFEMRGP